MNYEGLRQLLGISSIFPTPDQNARNEILPCSAVPGCTDSAPHNVGVNPATAAIVNIYPVPNGPELGGGIAENLQSLSEPQHENYILGRIDHNFSASDSLFGRYLFDGGGLITTPNPVSAQSVQNYAHDQYFTMTERKLISPTLINSAMLGFTRTYNHLTVGTAPGFTVFPGRPAMWIFTGGLGNFSGDPFNQVKTVSPYLTTCSGRTESIR